MLSSVLAFTLLLVAAADNISTARKAYAICLERFMVKGLDDKLEPEAFDTALGSACSVESGVLIRTAVSAAVAAKRKGADAEEMARGDMEDYQINTKDLFRQYKEKGAKPVLR